MKVITAKEFGKLIRDTRRKSKLTQAQLAAASGTGERFVRELEKGKPTAQLGKALLIAQMLGIKFIAELPLIE
jgi:y4mF family transcriptional regulator